MPSIDALQIKGSTSSGAALSLARATASANWRARIRETSSSSLFLIKLMLPSCGEKGRPGKAESMPLADDPPMAGNLEDGST